MIFTSSYPVNATSYRTFGKVYTNDTDYGLMVTVGQVDATSGGSRAMQAFVDNELVAELYISDAPAGKGMISFYVPPRKSYYVTAGTFRMRSWVETYTSAPDPGYVIVKNVTAKGVDYRNDDAFQQLHLVTLRSSGGTNQIFVDNELVAATRISTYVMNYTVAVFLPPGGVMRVEGSSAITRWITYRFSGVMPHTPPVQSGWAINHNVTSSNGNFIAGTYQLTLTSPETITSTDWFIEGEGHTSKTDPMNTFKILNVSTTTGSLVIETIGMNDSRPYIDVGCIANGTRYISTRIRLRNTNQLQPRLSIITLNGETPTSAARQKLVRSYILRYEALGIDVTSAAWRLPGGSMEGVTLSTEGILTIQPITRLGAFEVELVINGTITQRGFITVG